MDTCAEELPYESEVTLALGQAATGFEFVRFSGNGPCATGPSPTEVRFTLRQNVVCTAEFRPVSTMTADEPTFFVTSARFVPGSGVVDLASADAFCAASANASSFLSPAAKARVWRAFLGSAQGPNGPFIAATERIGPGPWRNTSEVNRTSFTLAGIRAAGRGGVLGVLDDRLYDENSRPLPALDDEVITGYGQIATQLAAPFDANQNGRSDPGDDVNGDGLINELDLERAFLMNEVTRAASRGTRPFCDGYRSVMTPWGSSVFRRTCDAASNHAVGIGNVIPRTMTPGFHLYCFAQ
jgi:hypothetical protein